MKYSFTFLIVCAFQLLSNLLLAQTYPVPATYSNSNEIYNINGQAHGSFFNDPINQESGLNYYGRSLVYQSNLWFGGKDANGEIHGSFQNYAESGYDNLAGPVANVYNENAVFNIWNKSYYITLSEVENHMDNWASPGYTIPQSLLQWPAHGNVSLGEAAQLAPFRDLNNNNQYEPQLGEYPEFPGDFCILTLFNDNRPHGESNCLPVKAEVYQYVYWFDALERPEFYKTIFSKHHLINRSNQSYSDFRVGLLVDGDIGYFFDDYMGCDPALNLGYFYNGNIFDNIDLGWGASVPAFGITQLNGTFSGFMGDIFRVPQPTSMLTCDQYYKGLGRIWPDGSHLKEGGNGYNPAGQDAEFIFNDQNNWVEMNIENVVGERKGILCSDIGTLMPAQEICVDYAFMFEPNQGAFPREEVIDSLKADISRILNNPFVQALTSNCTVTLSSKNKLLTQPDFQIFPNPGNGLFTFRSTKQVKYTIYDTQGRILDSFSCNGQCFWNASDLPSGMFIVVAQSEDGSLATRRLVNF